MLKTLVFSLLNPFWSLPRNRSLLFLLYLYMLSHSDTESQTNTEFFYSLRKDFLMWSSSRGWEKMDYHVDAKSLWHPYIRWETGFGYTHIASGIKEKQNRHTHPLWWKDDCGTTVRGSWTHCNGGIKGREVPWAGYGEGEEGKLEAPTAIGLGKGMKDLPLKYIIFPQYKLMLCLYTILVQDS